MPSSFPWFLKRRLPSHGLLPLGRLSAPGLQRLHIPIGRGAGRPAPGHLAPVSVVAASSEVRSRPASFVLDFRAMLVDQTCMARSNLRRWWLRGAFSPVQADRLVALTKPGRETE
jgi:hypothetical protein